jgi:sporulation protein YlmC with PRC-barrel domain
MVESMKPNVLSATTMIGDAVRNPQGEELGELEELMIDLDAGRIAYAVLSFGGFLGIGDKLFAIPILLVLLLLGALPVWPYSRRWGYFPSGILGVLLVILIVLLLAGII